MPPLFFQPGQESPNLDPAPASAFLPWKFHEGETGPARPRLSGQRVPPRRARRIPLEWVGKLGNELEVEGTFQEVGNAPGLSQMGLGSQLRRAQVHQGPNPGLVGWKSTR